MNAFILMRGLFSKAHHYRPRFSLAASSAPPLKNVVQDQVVYSGCVHLNHHNYEMPTPSIYSAAYLCHFFSTMHSGILWEGSSRITLVRKLEIALKDHNLDEAWETFNDLKRLHGFPNKSIVSRLIVLMTYSTSPHWLHKAYNLVLVMFEGSSHLLHCDSLSRLALTLARAQIPVPASTILRIMLGNNQFPHMDVWSMVFFHIVKTRIGSYIASNILIEICECILLHNANEKNPESMLIKPNTTIFNLVLHSCVQYESTLKAQQISELMTQIGVIADANSIIVVARVYEINGRRDDLKKLKEHIDCVSSALLAHHYRQFYDCLLSLHFKFNDIDAAAQLMLDLYRRPNYLGCSTGFMTSKSRLQKSCLVQVGSSNLKTGHKMPVNPQMLQNDFVVEAKSYNGLVLLQDGKLVPSKKAISKVIYCYVRDRKVDKLSNLLISMHKEMGFTDEASLGSDVIDACIQMGWLETAHDILDDIEAAGIPIRRVTCISLMRAYCKENMLKEAKLLLKQMMKNTSLLVTDEMVISFSQSKSTTMNPFNSGSQTLVRDTCLVDLLDRLSREENSESQFLYEFNSSISFFCKANMIEDALKTFKRMQEKKVHPTVQTFSNLVSGYSLLKMYRQITILWGEIKRSLENGVLVPNRDLFECLLLNFIRGGYFERVMEVVSCMMKHNMYADKWNYKREFLKFHKDLYRSSKASNARTEAQTNRLEHVRAFRRWVGINGRA